jgi:hypothetical protein
LRPRFAHRPGYHEWPCSTPLLDVARILVAVAAVMIGGYALMFLVFAVRDGNWGVVAKYVLIIVTLALWCAVLELLIRWRRHHG